MVEGASIQWITRSCVMSSMIRIPSFLLMFEQSYCLYRSQRGYDHARRVLLSERTAKIPFCNSNSAHNEHR